MLNYSIKISNREARDYIELDDFYIKPDLSILSGTTARTQDLSVNDEFWVSSQFLPFDKKVEVESVTVVIRNGYILQKVDLEIQVLYYHNEAQGTDTPIHYVEMDDVVYYEKNGRYDINGDIIIVTENQGSISVLKKIYVEAGKVVINGEVFSVTVNNNGVIISDSMGGGCPYDINTSHVDKTPMEVYKLVFRNERERTIDIKNITRFGYVPYIVYNDERIKFAKLIDDEGNFIGYGVRVDGVNYPMESESVDTFEMGLSNPENYRNLEYDGEIGISINGVDYKVYFEPMDYEEGDYLCIETAKPNPTVMIGDTITLKSIHYTNTVDVIGEGQNKYTFINGIRHNSIKNLCDTINVGGKYYWLDYQGDSSNPYVGMLAIVDYGNNKETFKVLSVSNGQVKSLVKMKEVDGVWKEAYTILEGANGGSEYAKATNYRIYHNDGFLIDNEVYPIEISESYDAEGYVIDTKNIINIKKPIEYDLKVYAVLGNNKIICTVDIDREIVQTEDYYSQKNIIFSSLTANRDFTLFRRGSMFGMKALTVKKWLKEAVEAPNSSSTYVLSQSKEKIRLYYENSSISVPVVLCSDINNNLNREDLLRDYYCTEKEEFAVNKIVDMEKDIYTPVIRSNGNILPVENIYFNLHFRTRELDTWRQIKDYGKNNVSGGKENVDYTENLHVGNALSNWFITDCYPYNDVLSDATNEDIEKVLNLSDLLGFLYFTTNDVEVKRPKLSGSFLRLTYYDSRDPEKQNMLGTSTVYFDTDNYYNILRKSKEGENVVYQDVALSLNPNRIPGVTTTSGAFQPDYDQTISVFTEAYNKVEEQVTYTTKNLLYDEGKRLSSQIKVTDRYNTTHSSEGFYSYLLKHIANKKKKQTIYLKIEFFHAGLGIKIPMVIATDENKNAINQWTQDRLSKFKKGYDTKEIYMRQYIPIDISYSLDRREFVYEISMKNGFSLAINKGNDLVFNLFEIKTKSN